MFLAMVFILFTAFVAISILGHTITHTRILGSRLKKINQTTGIIQETIRYLHDFAEKIFSEQNSGLLSPDRRYFNPDFFPDVRLKQMVIKNHFGFQEFANPLFKKTRITNTIFVSAETNNRLIKSGAAVDILSGKIPLALIPFFVHQKINTAEENYLSENRIDLINTQNPVINDIPIDFDISDFLIDSLKISGETLSWSKLRERFGLEISDEPLKQGIYLVSEGDAIESVFIQGDLQRLIFTAGDDTQKLEFHLQDGTYELTYIPGEPYFFCPDPLIGNCLLFKEKIIVNGNVWSLEQGHGTRAFREDSNLTLLVSGQTVIRTSLETRNLDLKKLKLNNLTLVCGHHSLFDPPETPARILVESNDQIHVQASVLVNGILENNSEQLQITGSLFADEIRNQGRIQLSARKPGNSSGAYFNTIEFTFISAFFVDFIEEVPDA